MPDTRHTAWLRSEDDVAGFRAAARRLVAAGVPPGDVSWHVAAAAESDLFALADAPDASAMVPVQPTDAAGHGATATLRLPAAFVDCCERAGLHADPGRFGLLYRLVWRLAYEPGLRDDPLDADRMLADRMARAVRRDMHKMTAFVRFRPLPAPAGEAWPVVHVAWFEPAHHIARATAPFFARRFAQMAWAILTPQCSVRWDGRALSFGPRAQRADAPSADAGEQLWLTYYQSIFNPARLKLAMMQKEMPRKYWKNLPEATLIHPLAVQAAQRSDHMVAQGPSEPVHRRPAASAALRIQYGIQHGIDHRPGMAAQADAIDTLPALAQAIEHCRNCPIGALATQGVAGVGAVGARLMLVGEQPGDQEDLHGRPFVGPAGQLLERALAELHWPRDALYLTNAVKHFKYTLSGKRRIHKTPAQREAAACLQWLEHEIELVRPQAAIALGATAARALLGRPVAVTGERGSWQLRPDGLPVLVTLHPAALLRMDPQGFDAALAAWLADLRQASRYAMAPLSVPEFTAAAG